MRTIEVMNHEIEFFLKDSDGNERLEPLTNDGDFADAIQNDIYNNDAMNGELFESIVDKDGNVVECSGEWYIKKPVEQKVFVIPGRMYNEKLTEEEFMEISEKIGTVYSLYGFQCAFNRGEVTDEHWILIK
jgi:hypothetical protein